jgi:1-acyl-sn-glycerol-3-phosphate acyltransferase
VRENRKESLVEAMIKRFRKESRLVVAITPEGTRKATAQWHTGFLRIAYETNVPICLAVVDFKMKKAMIHDTFQPTGDIEADMKAIKQYYRPYTGYHPEKFITE